MIGTTLSHYKVLEKIGQGGMGEVYRAEDTNLSREVAIKVLPEQFTSDPQRLARFEREAKLLAQLNHPNIAAIYGFEKAEGVHFLALELVEGETLAERVAKGPLPVEEALEVCRQIAEGVEAAHEKGVIHRDLKPANVKVTPEGKVKILDFGLAKAFEEEVSEADISQSPTLTEEMTRAGVILGTAAYMSPEQAKGKPADKRADVFAFGAMLYELLTGKRAFQGDTITEMLAKILEGEPDWKAVPQNTPARISELMVDCLEKDSGDRLPDIGSARLQIKKALKEPTTSPPTVVRSTVQPAQRRWSMTVGLVAGAVVSGLAVWLLIQPSSPEQELNRFVITPSPPARFLGTSMGDVAISLDGRHLVYLVSRETGEQLYLRSLDDFVDRPIPGTEGAIGNPFFSPDGEWVAFFTPQQLKKVALAGGPPIPICDAGFGGRSGSWFEDTIVFASTGESGRGLYRVPAAGGEPIILATVNPDEEESRYFSPQFLPDGKALLFSVGFASGEVQTSVLSLETMEQKLVLKNAKQAYNSPTGHLIYEQTGTGNLMAAPFDSTTLEVTGNSVLVVQQVSQYNDPGFVDYSVSENGTLVYVPGAVDASSTLVWVDRQGQEEPLAVEPGMYFHPRISPDGSRLAVSIRESDAEDVWIYDLEREIATRFTFDPAVNHMPVWTPDGLHVVFDSNRDGGEQHNLFWKAADGTGQVERLTTSPNDQMAHSFSPNGKRLVFSARYRENPDSDLNVLLMDDEATQHQLLHTEVFEYEAEISPDGHWIAYVSDETGQEEIYVRPFPNVQEGKWQISMDGGLVPVWGPQGRELFYGRGDAIMGVTVETDPTFKAASHRVLIRGSDRLGGEGRRNYDISPDGQRFLMIQAVEGSTAQINVVLNWDEELKRLVPTK